MKRLLYTFFIERLMLQPGLHGGCVSKYYSTFSSTDSFLFPKYFFRFFSKVAINRMGFLKLLWQVEFFFLHNPSESLKTTCGLCQVILFSCYIRKFDRFIMTTLLEKNLIADDKLFEKKILLDKNSTKRNYRLHLFFSYPEILRKVISETTTSVHWYCDNKTYTRFPSGEKEKGENLYLYISLLMQFLSYLIIDIYKNIYIYTYILDSHVYRVGWHLMRTCLDNVPRA